jgi:Pectate lyase superfamily protein
MAVVQISQISHRSGLLENLPQLAKAELGWSVDQRRLFIGNGLLSDGAPETGNTEILTEYSQILQLAETYTFKNPDAGYTASTGGSKSQYNAMVVGNGIYVAVGNNGSIVYSLDGQVWNNTTSGTKNSLFGVTYGQGTFVAVGGNGTILYSSDGRVWKQPAAIQDYININVYNTNDLVNYQGHVYKAKAITQGNLPTNPAYWSSYTLGTVPYTGINDIAYGLIGTTGYFVLVTTMGYIYTSTDAVNWTLSSSGVNTNINAITYNSNKFVAVGSAGVVLIGTGSTNITWTNSTISNYDLFGIRYDGTYYIATGHKNKVYHSTDLITWNRTLIDGFTSTTSSGSHVYAITSWGDVYKDNGSLQFTQIGTVASGIENFSVIYYANSIFVAMTFSGGIYISSDAITWTAKSGGPAALNDVYYDSNANRFVIAADGGYLGTTTNNFTTTTFSLHGTNSFKGISQLNNLYIAVGDAGVIYYSTDANIWNTASSGTTQNLRGITVANLGGGTYKAIAVGWNGIAITSATGTGAWTTVLSNSAIDQRNNTVSLSNLRRVIYANYVDPVTSANLSKYIIVGDNGVVVESTSAASSSWVTTDTYTEGHLTGITYNSSSGYFWVVGDTGLTYLNSNNSVTWNSQSLYYGSTSVSPDIKDVATNGTIDVLVGQFGLLYKATSQVKFFRKITQSIGTDINSIIYRTTQFIIAGNNGVLGYSTDGVTYTAQGYSYGDALTTRSLQQKLDDFVSVKDFGAKGDGITDDTESINRAMYELYCRSISTTGKKVLYFPAGNYIITSDLRVPSYARLRGEGTTNTLITQTRSPYIAPYITWCMYTADNMQQTQTLLGLNGASLPTDITVEDMSLISTGDGMIIDSASRVTLINVRFKGPKTSVNLLNDVTLGVPTAGVRFQGYSLTVSSDVNMTDCLFDGFNVGAYLPANQNISNTLMDSCTFQNCNIGIYLVGNSAKNVSVTNSFMDQIYSYGCYVSNSNNFLSLANYYKEVATNLTGTPTVETIYFTNTVTGGASLGDTFKRTNADNLNISIVNEAANTTEWNFSEGLRLGTVQFNMGNTLTLPDSNTAVIGTGFDDYVLSAGEPATAYEFLYSISRKGAVRFGTLRLTLLYNGTYGLDDDFNQTGDTGVTFSFNGSDLVYTTDTPGTAGTGTLNYAIRYLEM